MAAFEYTAIGPTGKREQGIISADTPRAARRELRLRQLTPLEVNQAKSAQESRFNFSNRLSVKERTLITRQIAMLLQAGLTVEEALAATASEGGKPATRKLLLGVRSEVMEGFSFADALSHAPQAFPKLYRAVVAAGEASGRPGEVMEQLAEYLERARKVRQQVTSALIYPAVLSVMAISMVTALMIFVVPRMIEQFDVFGADLPALTRGVVAVSEFLQNWGVAMLIVLMLIGIGIWQALKVKTIRRRVDAALLRLPIIGTMQRTVLAARFARIYATLATSGATVLESLAGARGAMTNLVFVDATDKIAESVTEGGSLSGAMRSSGVFPPLLSHMAASGEAGGASGNLPEMMNRAATYLEEDFEASTNMALSLLEPAIIIVMGGIVGTIVLSIMLPIMRLNALAIG